MKALIIAVCFLGTTAAFGQVAGGTISSRPQPLSFEYNPQHATWQPMAEAQNLYGSSSATYTYGQGERPLWEVAEPKYEVPLGDSARALRKEHDVVKKASRIWNN
jgi:hypothetical protein